MSELNQPNGGGTPAVRPFLFWDRLVENEATVKHHFGFREGGGVVLVEMLNANDEGKYRYIGFTPERESMPEEVQLEDFEYCDDGGVTMPYPVCVEGRWHWRWRNSLDHDFSFDQPMTPNETTAFLTILYFSEFAGVARRYLVSCYDLSAPSTENN